MTFLDDDDLRQLIQDNLEHLSRFPLPRALYPALANSRRRAIRIERLPGQPRQYEACIDLYLELEDGKELSGHGYNVTVPCRSEREALECLLLALAAEVRSYLEDPRKGVV